MLISIVTPVFNEELILDQFYKRVSDVFKSLDVDFEVVFIDDGSTDTSWQKLEKLHAADQRVNAVRFSRNFGYSAAMSAGLDFARGDAVVIIDSDLQDPPELIPSLIEQWKKGFDIVYAVRKRREGETFFKKITASIFYRLLRLLSQVDIPADTGDFRLVSRRVILALQSFPERVRFVRGLTSWTGFPQTGISYERESRTVGETKFKLMKMVRFAFDGITSFSSAPLSVANYLGLFATGVAFFVLIYAFYMHWSGAGTVPGWTSTIVCVLFLGGIQLLTLGILGEYIGRIYQEIKGRPLYLVDRALGSISHEKHY